RRHAGRAPLLARSGALFGHRAPGDRRAAPPRRPLSDAHLPACRCTRERDPELIRVVVSHHRARWPGGPDRVLHRARPGPGGRRVAGAGMRTMVVGHGGRESALAMRMAEHSELHAFVGHANPTIVRHAQSSGGSYALGDVCDPQAVAAFARERGVDIAMVSADEPLAAGVVDALLAQGTQTVGPTRAGAEIEWNKAFARELLGEVAPQAAPRLRVVRSRPELEEAFAAFGETPVAVTPLGLTCGK